MTQKSPVLFLLTVIFMIGTIIAGCDSSPSNEPSPTSFLQTQSISTVTTPSPSETPTKKQTVSDPTPTFPPTIIPAQEDNLIRLLKDATCKLPCYLGITPGRTSWIEAQAILKDIGAYRVANGWGDGMRTYGYIMWIGDPSLSTMTRDPNMVVDDMEIFQSLGFSVWENIVHRIRVEITTRTFAQKLNEYWMKYSFENIFFQLGPPGFISFSKSYKNYNRFTQFIVFQNFGIVVETLGTKKDNKICPILVDGTPGNSARLSFTLTNLDFGLGIYGPGQILPTDQTVYLPIEETLGITEQEYYDRIISDPSNCFILKP